MNPHFRRGIRHIASSAPFGPALLPDEEKKHLARALLSEFGVTSVTERDDELIHSCCLPFGAHKNGDRSPSASLNWSKLTYNPVAAETLVKTYHGERPIHELAGSRHLLMDGDGKWVESEVISSGVHPLLKITLRRNGRVREVFATAEHRWMVEKAGGLEERTSSTLTPRDSIPSVWSHQRAGRLTVSPFGVAAGFVFGDGTQTRWGSVANFIGMKDEALVPFFAGLPLRKTLVGNQVRVGLPRSWKTDLPTLDEGPSYLYGWLAGYFAADGCVADDGSVTLSCAKREVLDHVVAICDRIGVATWGISERVRGGYGEEVSSIFTLSLRRRSLTDDFFIIPEHRRRVIQANTKRSNERTNWWVVSVEETGRVEEVFCAIVPTTHSFVLSDNILTGNCLGCGMSGGLLWFIAVCRGESSEQARHWVEQQSGETDDEEGLAALLRFIEAVYNPENTAYTPPIPRMSPKVLDQWRAIHPWVVDPLPDGRGIPIETAMRFNVGYGWISVPLGEHRVSSERIVLPHFWQGELVGWQSRRLNKADGTAKYISSPDLPKDTTLFNYQERGPAVVVESQMSVLSKFHVCPEMESTFGAKVTDRQMRLLSRHSSVTLWMDNDDAGWLATKRMGDALAPYCPVFVVPSTLAADPADIADERLFLDLLDERVPYQLWSPPAHLEEMVYSSASTAQGGD